MPITIASLIEASVPISDSLDSAFERLDVEIADLVLWARDKEIRAGSSLAILAESYPALPRSNDPSDPGRWLPLQGLLRRLPDAVIRQMADLIIDKPTRRAMTLADDPYEYLRTQVADGWVQIRMLGTKGPAGSPQALIDYADRLRECLIPAGAQKEAERLSHLYHAGPVPGEPNRFYVRRTQISVPQPETIVTESWHIVDRLNDHVITTYTDPDRAHERCALINRHPQAGAAFAQAARLTWELKIEVACHSAEPILRRAHDRARAIAEELMTLLQEIDTVSKANRI